jgi:hypothetical protein
MTKYGRGENRSLNPFKTWGRYISGDEDKSFLGSEEVLAQQDIEDQGRTERLFRIRDKWGDRYLEKHHKMGRYNPLRMMARAFGGGAFGKRRSFEPNEFQKYLEALGPTEDLNIIAHGGGDKVGGYTPAKLVRLLLRLGMDPKEHKGPIWLRGCIAAWRPNGKDKSSFVELMAQELKNQGFSNEVYGLAGLANSYTGEGIDPRTGKREPGRQIGREEEFNVEKYAKKEKHQTTIKSLQAQQKQLRDNPGREWKRKTKVGKWNPFKWTLAKKKPDQKEINNLAGQIRSEKEAAGKITFNTTERNWIRGSDFTGIGATPVNPLQQPLTDDTSSDKQTSGVPSDSSVPGPPSPLVEKLRNQLEKVVGIDTVFGCDTAINEVMLKRVPVEMLTTFLTEKLYTELELSGRGYDLAVEYVYEELAHRGYRFIG